ncbi:MAG TPA: aminomethyl-transferring glycine dehydrogenase subunit GcvPB [Eubacteriaceae bacterium]|jgi:glycine dehydrogenase subunit 2|nr:aminomethyl-transferring glycine dehydrogenase subunit GcvPB [Eubacteriaceae bacterium]
MKNYDKLIFEISKKDRIGYTLPKWELENEVEIPENLLREEELHLPEVSENQIIRHYTALSKKNYGVDIGFYPLGSCTMKYNPKINEEMAGLSKFTTLHPYQSLENIQGSLELMYNLSNDLCEITGMDHFTLQPAAGAQGELVGLMMIKAYHKKRGDTKRTKIIVPDSAHGTNPATAHVAGFNVVEVQSDYRGDIDLNSLKKVLDDEVAGLMLTNPSTLGLFERNIEEISRLVHEAGGLLYYDGANLNAIMGKARPGDMGFDVVHLNLHKTFSTPHGGGGPGSGPVGVKENLRPFLPLPIIEKQEENYILNDNYPDSIGKVKSFYGNFGVLVRAYSYILTMGAEGLKRASEMAVLNANYIQERLKEHYYLPIDETCMHEFVLGGLGDQLGEVTTLDIAKRIIDYGYHPPTMYFPLIIPEALMIEPTETESLEELENFIEVMIKISKEAREKPELLKNAPNNTAIKRIDEVRAARKPILKWDRG